MLGEVSQPLSSALSAIPHMVVGNTKELILNTRQLVEEKKRVDLTGVELMKS